MNKRDSRKTTGQIIYYCTDCGKEYAISRQKERTFDGKICDRCGSRLVVPKTK